MIADQSVERAVPLSGCSEHTRFVDIDPQRTCRPIPVDDLTAGPKARARVEADPGQPAEIHRADHRGHCQSRAGAILLHEDRHATASHGGR